MLRREHDEQARRHIATVMTGGDDEGGGGVNLRAVCLVRAIVVCVGGVVVDVDDGDGCW